MALPSFATLLVSVLIGNACGDAGELNTPVKTNRCGANCLLMLFEFYGVAFSKDSLLAIDCGDEGASLITLREAAEDAGMKLEVRRFRVEEWRQIPLPAIIHRRHDAKRFHYDLWYDRTWNSIKAIDGTTGKEFVILSRNVPRCWTGYALIRDFRLGSLTMAKYLLGIGWGVVVLHFAYRIVRHCHAIKCLGMVALVILVPRSLLSWDGTIAEVPSFVEVPISWRHPSHGAANSLFVYLAIGDRTLSYAEFFRRLPNGRLPDSAYELVAAAKEFNVPLKAVSLTEAEWDRLPLPAIVHLDGPQVGKGAFIVVTRAFPHDFEYVNGPTATVGYMRYEDFFRRWSGIALIERTKSEWRMGHYIGAFIIGLALSMVSSMGAKVVGGVLRRRSGILLHCWVWGCVFAVAWLNSSDICAQSANDGNRYDAMMPAIATQVTAISTCMLDTEDTYDYRSGPPKTRMVSAEILFHLDAGKCFLQRSQVILRKDGSISRRENEFSYDGKVFFMGYPEQDGTAHWMTLMGDNPDSRGADERMTEHNYLKGAGFVVPETPRDWLDLRLESTVAKLLKSGSEVEVQQQNDLISISAELPDELVLAARKVDLDAFEAELKSADSDPLFIRREMAALEASRRAEPIKRCQCLVDSRKGHAVVQYREWTADGRMRISIVADDFQKHNRMAEASDRGSVDDNAIWLPRECKIRWYFIPNTFLDHAETPYLTITSRLDAIDFAPPSRSFSISYDTPGTLVADRSSKASRDAPGGQIDFKIDANPELLRQAARQARWRTVLVILFNLLILGAAAAFYLLCILRKHRP